MFHVFLGKKKTDITNHSSHEFNDQWSKNCQMFGEDDSNWNTLVIPEALRYLMMLLESLSFIYNCLSKYSIVVILPKKCERKVTIVFVVCGSGIFHTSFSSFQALMLKQIQDTGALTTIKLYFNHHQPWDMSEFRAFLALIWGGMHCRI